MVMANSNSTKPPDNLDPKVEEVCDDIELLTSLKCECGARRDEFETIAIICRGRNNFKQTMVYSNGKVILTETCVNYIDSVEDKTNLVCVKEYYFDFSGHGSEPATCEASVDGERCPFCMPMSRGYFNKESPDCQHGLSVRCGDAGYGSICTLPDGTKKMTQFITSNTYNRKYSSTSSGISFDPVTVVGFLAFVFIFAVAKLLRHGPETPNGNRTNYDEFELHNEMA